MNSILKFASILDKSGHYELSDELFKIAQKNVVQQGVTNTLSQAQGAKTTYDLGKSAVDITSFLSRYFKRYIPSFIQTLNTVKSSLDKFEGNPAIDKILSGLDLKSFVEDTIEFLTNINTMGFFNYYKTDAKGVTQFFISLISTINQLAGYIPIFAPMKIQLQAIDSSMNALNTMVSLTDIAGTMSGTTNSALRNFTSLNNPNEAPTLGYGMRPGLTFDPNKTKQKDLIAKGGDVHNVLLDFVLKKGPIQTLINKHILDSDPEKPQKMAQIMAAIKQNKLPDPKSGYSKSDRQMKLEQEEYRKTHPDVSFDNYQLAEWNAMRAQEKFFTDNIANPIQRFVVKPVQKGINTLVRNYNNSLPTGTNTGYVSPEKMRATRFQQ